MMGYGMMGPGMYLFMFLWWAVIITGVVLIGFGIYRLIWGRERMGNKEPLERLIHRLAAGEITIEQFNEYKNIIEQKGRSSPV